jgi:hypothetical protein
MRNPMRSRRSSPLLRIHSTDAVNGAGGDRLELRQLPWLVIAAGSGLVAAAAGWAVLVALVLVAWLTAPAGEFGDVVGSATQLWLLAHGGGLAVAGVRWTLVPLGITVGLGLVLRYLAASAARRGIESARAAGVGEADIDRARVVRACTLATGVSYATAVTLVGVAGSVNQGIRTAAGVLLFAAVTAGWGACRGAGFRVADALPGWARPVPAAVLAATGTVLCGGAAALTTGLIQHHERVAAIAAGLGADAMSTVQLTLAQLLFLPNLVIWAGAWTMGAGFTFGQGSVVSPPSTDLGLLPSIPVLGALPAEGAGVWSLLWLLTGVIAGAVAVAVVLRYSPRARFEEVALVSGFSGVMAALLFTLLAVAARGDLGVDRLTGLGPRPGELVVLTSALIGMSGLLVGMVAGSVRQFRRRPGAANPIAGQPMDDFEVTRPLGDKVAP